MINVKLLKNFSNFKKIKKGTILINENEGMGNQMYILLVGKAGAYKNFGKLSQIMISEFNPGDFFGEMTLFLNRNRTATVIALSELTVLEITRESAYHFFENAPEATYLLIQALCERIDDLNKSYLSLHAQLHPELYEEDENEETASSETSEPTETPVKTAKAISSSLYPEGHKGYVFPDPLTDESLIYVKSLTCPMCESKFTYPILRTSKIKKLSTDNDLRVHYQDVNTTHYLVATCPHCLFSAIADDFEKASTAKVDLVLKATKEYKSELDLDFADMESETVFARIYLALICMPLCYRKPVLFEARLWLNLSWLYHDCGDEDMEMFAANNALKAYLKAYSTVDINKKNEQRMCIIIGELSHKVGDIANAKKFFYMAKINRDDKTLSDLADDRINEIRKSSIDSQ